MNLTDEAFDFPIVHLLESPYLPKNQSEQDIVMVLQSTNQ
jgi:hypothetical protein